MFTLPKAGLLLSVAAVASACSTALASASFSNLPAFLAEVRGDFDLETFEGPTDYRLEPQVFHKASGYSFTLTGSVGNNTVFRHPLGVGAAFPQESTRLLFTARPVSALSATFRVLNHLAQDVGGSIMIGTNAGETFHIPVPPGGAFFGFTANLPFTALTINAENAQYETIDDLRIGTAARLIQAADLCAAAPVINFGVYPFTSIGATTDGSGSACRHMPEHSNDVWFRLVPSASGSVDLFTCSAADFDTVLEVFDGCGGTALACNDDACEILSSHVRVRVEGGRAYVVRISGYFGATGTGVLTINHVPDCPADVNHSGQVSVQDLFDFMAGLFGACP